MDNATKVSNDIWWDVKDEVDNEVPTEIRQQVWFRCGDLIWFAVDRRIGEQVYWGIRNE